VWPATCCDLADVVGGQVGRWVGGLALPPWAPVAEEGAVVGHDLTSALALARVVVQVGASCLLGLVDAGMTVPTPGLAAYLLAAVEAWAQ
jgi:hypothetical protein